MNNHVSFFSVIVVYPLKDNFIIITINIESIMAKIDKLKELIDILSSKDIIISAINLQETWLGENADINLLKLNGFHDPVHLPRICGRKGGLMTYINNKYRAPIKRDNVYKSCKDWEALIVDVNYEFFDSKIKLNNDLHPNECMMIFFHISKNSFCKPFHFRI